ncbi:MAG: TIGR03960 family B12-binding radical SAM protein, partial [Phycisphaerales bacterium]
MTKKQPQIIAKQIERDLLPFVRRPSRYIGGEVNQTKKDLAECDLTVALCFPDIYEIGMSHTGLAIIYDILNNVEGIAAERVFCPWIDAEQLMREKNIPLFSLESKATIKSLDIIGFSLTNELCYTNMLNMLDLAGLNIHSKDRGEDDPLIIAGGQMANCCEPIADFVDLFILGEAEVAVVQLAEVIRRCKKQKKSKTDILLDAANQFDWAYVPSLYRAEKMQLLSNAVVEDFDNAPVPSSPIVPFTQAVHERVSVEVMRGCPGRCRFCQASFCRRPIRYRSVDRIFEIAKAAQKTTGFDTVSLLSLSTADYPQLEELVTKLHNFFKDKYIGLSVPSLRVDKHLKLLPEFVNSVRKSGLTIAVEAASESLRQIINKPLKDDDLFAAVEAAYKAGWRKLKLYFMVGLPGETEDDIKNIVNISAKLARLRRQFDGKTAQINITVSWLVPKPHTPLAWLGQKSKDYFATAKRTILDEKRKLGAKSLQFKFHNIERSLLESAIGRGDRQLGQVIETAWRNGAKF